MRAILALYSSRAHAAQFTIPVMYRSPTPARRCSRRSRAGHAGDRGDLARGRRRDRIFDRAHARGVRHQRRARHDRHRRRRHARRRRRVRAAGLSRALSRDHRRGGRRWRRPTGGSTTSPEHVVREHACLRFGAHLAERFGLRARDGADHRLPRLLRRARRRSAGARRRSGDADRDGGARPVRRLDVARTDRGGARAHGGARGAAARIRSGFAWGPAAETCGGCAWLYVGGRGAPVARCRQSRAGGRRRSADRAGTPRLRALGAARRLPALRRLLPRGLSLGHRLGARSGRLEGARPDRPPRAPLRDPPRRASAARRSKVGAPGATPRYACTIYDNRPQPLPRVRGRRAALPRCAPARRALRESGSGVPARWTQR